MQTTSSERLDQVLLDALKQADTYLNLHDTSAPSRAKAETRAAVEEAIGKANAARTNDQRDAFFASVRAIDALCPACKQPQNAPSCERREHRGVR